MTTQDIPTAEQVVTGALLAVSQALHDACDERQRALLRRVTSGVPLTELREHQLRTAYEVMRRSMDPDRDTSVKFPEGGAYVLDLSWERPPLSRNGGRGHAIARSKTVKALRKEGWARARDAKIPTYQFVVVRLHYAPGIRRHQDPMNWTDTSKALIDGLRDAGVVPDDDTRHLTELEPEILYPPEPGPRCWLTVVPVA